MKKSIIIILFLLCLFSVFPDDFYQIDVKIEKPEKKGTIQLIYKIQGKAFLKNIEIVKIKETIYLYYNFELNSKRVFTYGLLISGNYFMVGDIYDFDRIFYSDDAISNQIISQYHKTPLDVCKIYFGDYPISLKKTIIDGRKRWEFYQDDILLFALEDY